MTLNEPEIRIRPPINDGLKKIARYYVDFGTIETSREGSPPEISVVSDVPYKYQLGVTWISITKLQKRRTHFTKLVYDILPTTAQANKFDRGKRACPMCPCEVENRDHVLKCRSPSATQWRADFETLIQFFQETQTTPVIQELALSVSEKWFLAIEDLTLDPQDYPAQVTNIILEQNAIGWRQLFNGRFSKAWSKLQDEAYSRSPSQEG